MRQNNSSFRVLMYNYFCPFCCILVQMDGTLCFSVDGEGGMCLVFAYDRQGLLHQVIHIDNWQQY